ncbi:hypothetical protein FEP99_06157 [Burkholderia pseudomultivorans]|nr:hypothetical protein [Burkholderia pseudomultivorans]
MRVRPPGRIEEDQVARRDLVGVDRHAAAAHVGGRARQVHVGRATDHVAHEPAAVEAAGRRVAAPAIGHADQAHRLDRDFFLADAVVDEFREIGGRRERARRRDRHAGRARCRLRRHAGAGRKQRNDGDGNPDSKHERRNGRGAPVIRMTTDRPDGRRSGGACATIPENLLEVSRVNRCCFRNSALSTFPTPKIKRRSGVERRQASEAGRLAGAMRYRMSDA